MNRSNPFEIVRDWSPMEDLRAVERAAEERYRAVGYDPSPWPATTAQDFSDYRDLGLLWVAAVDRRAVGFAVVDAYGEYFHLEEIDVVPELQGRGIGAALIREVIAEARRRGSSFVTLRTFTTTPWSVGLYGKMGFRRWDPNPLPNYLDAIFEDERAMGLPREERLTMRLPIAKS